MWAKTKTNEYEYCVNCELDDLKHVAKGLCASCYWKKYNDCESRRKQKREYYQRYKEVISKKKKEKYALLNNKTNPVVS